MLYGNLAARQLFRHGHKLEGCRSTTCSSRCPRRCARRSAAIATRCSRSSSQGESQVFHLSQRRFLLNGQPHRLSLLKQLTREVNAQEVAIWKKVIRVIAHEINNSVAPIASLAQSGQRLAAEPDEAQLRRVFGAIEERMSHLSGFVDGYSRFAKLPRPRLAPVEWRRFLESLQPMSPFAPDGAWPAGVGHFDESQLQQVLLNLLRNAAEAGSPRGGDPGRRRSEPRRLAGRGRRPRRRHERRGARERAAAVLLDQGRRHGPRPHAVPRDRRGARRHASTSPTAPAAASPCASGCRAVQGLRESLDALVDPDAVAALQHLRAARHELPCGSSCR